MPEKNISAAELHNSIVDELRMEGIAFMGYGVLPKFVMLDSTLSLEAKAIYAYFCSYTGQGNTAFPSRDRILADLGINKDTYYRHYKQLLDQGYLMVVQQRSDSGFTRNIYTLVSAPEKFRHETQKAYLEKTYAVIRMGGLKAAGYGFIAKAVMTDQRLSIKAKGLYAYFCAFTGAGESAHPSLDTARQHLGISRPLYAKYAGQLRELNYITVTQRVKSDGKFGVNDVTIVDTPNISQATTGHVFKRDASTEPYVDFSDTQISDTQISDTQISDTKKNNIKNNNSSNYQSSHQQPAYDAYAHEDGWMDSEEPLSLDDIQDTLDAEGTIPESWVGNREVIYPAVRIITSYDERVANRSLNAGTGGDYTLFMEALTDMLCAARPMTLAGERVSAYDVRDHLERFLRKSDFYFGDGTLYLNEVDEVAIEAYAAACESKPIKNPLGYMKACIWTALKTGDAATRASVSYDAKNRS